MDCRKFRTYILPFLKEELDEKRTKKILQHMDQCVDCKEELKIQYMVWEGRRRLAHGGNFDLQADFKNMMEDARKKSEQIGKQQSIVTVFQLFSVLFVVVMLIKGLLY